MKTPLIVLALIILCGCKTSKYTSAGSGFNSPIATYEGAGLKRIFSASYNLVWTAALDCARQNELEIEKVNEANGFIETASVEHPAVEQVGIWVRETGEEATEVEVYSRGGGRNSDQARIRAETILDAIAVEFPAE